MDDHMPTRGLARLVPPPGGERRLREALRGRGTDAFGWRLPLAGACACLCVLVLAHALHDPMDIRIGHAVSEAVTPVADIRVVGARVERIATDDPNVRIYRVAGEPRMR